jgi:hypothetical protein
MGAVAAIMADVPVLGCGGASDERSRRFRSLELSLSKEVDMKEDGEIPFARACGASGTCRRYGVVYEGRGRMEEGGADRLAELNVGDAKGYLQGYQQG